MDERVEIKYVDKEDMQMKKINVGKERVQMKDMSLEKFMNVNE